MRAVNRRVFGAGLAICLLSASAWAQDGLRSASLPERNLNSVRTGRSVSSRSSFLLASGRSAVSAAIAGTGVFPAASGCLLTARMCRPGRPTIQRPPSSNEANGYLQFQVVPGTAEVRVDGFYVGSVDDVRRMGGARAGTRAAPASSSGPQDSRR